MKPARGLYALLAVLCLAVSLPAAAQETPALGTEISNVPADLSGAWREQGGPTLVRFEEERIFEVAEGKLLILGVIRRTQGGLLLRRAGHSEVWKATVKQGILNLEAKGKTRRFERLAEVPPELILQPFHLGTMHPLPLERIQEIQAELQRRYSLDQEPRQALLKAKRDPQLEARLREVDAANQRYIRDLLGEVGWIDLARFGQRAVSTATIMVKHHGDLAVQMAVLSYVEKDFGNVQVPEPYVVFFDGLRLNLGQPQRFGSQLGEDLTGKPCVLALEDAGRVDSFRREVGLPPLSDYLAQASRVIFGEAPIGLQCADLPDAQTTP